MNDTNDTDDIDAEQLANDIEATVSAMMERIDFEDDVDEDVDLGMGGLLPSLDAGMLVSNLMPMFRGKVESDPDATLKAAAILHLEMGALVEEHSDRDAVELATDR